MKPFGFQPSIIARPSGRGNLPLLRAAVWIAPRAKGRARAEAQSAGRPARLAAARGLQETITREDFTRLLEQVYAPHGGWQPYFRRGRRLRWSSASRTSRWMTCSPCASPRPTLARRRDRCRRPTGVSARTCRRPPHRASRWRGCGLPWTPATSADAGPSSRRAGSRSATAPPVMEGDMTLHVAETARRPPARTRRGGRGNPAARRRADHAAAARAIDGRGVQGVRRPGSL